MPGPDLTAVGAAFGRAAHVHLDDPPWILADTRSIELADEDALRAAELLTADGRLAMRRDDPRARWRATFVGRARFVEDLVADRLALGVDQYVILGAGLDTVAQRRPDLASRVRIFEVDQPRTQLWKQKRLRELTMPVPENLRFVPLDFEAGGSWVRAISDRGFRGAQPSTIASTGVTQYISVEALVTTMREVATLAPGTTFVCTFVLPVDLIDADERELRAITEERAVARGAPWISFYAPEELLSHATAAGFDDVRHVSARDLNERYFASRPDGLRAASGEQLIMATRTR